MLKFVAAAVVGLGLLGAVPVGAEARPVGRNHVTHVRHAHRGKVRPNYRAHYRSRHSRHGRRHYYNRLGRAWSNVPRGYRTR